MNIKQITVLVDDKNGNIRELTPYEAVSTGYKTTDGFITVSYEAAQKNQSIIDFNNRFFLIFDQYRSSGRFLTELRKNPQLVADAIKLLQEIITYPLK